MNIRRQICSFFLAFLGLAVSVPGQSGPLLDRPILDSSGAITLTLHGTPGTNYAMEYSGELMSWWSLSSELATNGLVQFNLPPPTGTRARYFRARVDVPLSPVNVVPQADTNSLDLGLVTPEEGGTVSLTDTNGVTYTLTVPTNAVTGPQVFELTLITNISGLPFKGSLLGAVSLGPDGLELAEPAQLQITFPTNTPIDPFQIAGYTFNLDGSFLRLNAVAADTNSIVMPVFALGGFGCSYASLTEIEDVSRRPVSNTDTPSKVGPSANRGGQPRSMYYGPTLLDQCYPAELARARVIDNTLAQDLERLHEELAANATRIMRAHPELGTLVSDWGPVHFFFWDGNSPDTYSLFYDTYVLRYINEANSNCAVTEVLAHRINDLKHLAAFYGGVFDSHAAERDLCTGFNHCLQEIDDCCKTQGITGPASRLQADLIVKEAAQYGCEVPDLGKDCLPMWSGSMSVVQVLTSKTNRSDGSVLFSDDYTEVSTVVYQTDANGLTAQSSPGYYGLTGNLIARGACRYDQLTVTVDTSCCGSCTTTTHSRSACTPKGTAYGAFAWILTNSPPNPVGLPLSSVVVPGNDLTLATHGVKRSTHTTHTLSFLASNPKGEPTCETTGGVNNFKGTYDFSGIPYMNFQTTIEGTTAAYTGSYETNIVHPDGVTTTRIQASWNFVRKQ
jgi:hypothetical protein